MHKRTSIAIKADFVLKIQLNKSSIDTNIPYIFSFGKTGKQSIHKAYVKVASLIIVLKHLYIKIKEHFFIQIKRHIT